MKILFFIFTSICLFIQTSFAQNAFIATYEHVESKSPYVGIYTLEYDGNFALYSRHQEFVETPLNDGSTMTYYTYHDHYDWLMKLDGPSIEERRILEDGTTLKWTGLPDLNWTITDETKTIGQHTVQKAVCASPYDTGNGPQGKELGDMIAWFTTEIPVSAGPERYYGLPGLIIALEYSNHDYLKTTLKEIRFLDNPSVVKITPFDDRGITVSMTEIVRPFKIDQSWLKDRKKELRKVTGAQWYK